MECKILKLPDYLNVTLNLCHLIDERNLTSREKFCLQKYAWRLYYRIVCMTFFEDYDKVCLYNKTM